MEPLNTLFDSGKGIVIVRSKHYNSRIVMKCPNCDLELKQHVYKGLKIDECESCDGKWFDRDELRLAKDKTDEDYRWIDFEIFGEKENEFKSNPGQKLCPKDANKMNSLTYMDSNVVIEKCDTCKGVWLDKNEFDKILKHLEGIVIATPSSEYGNETLKEFSEIFTGPESTISELKDFMSVANLFSVRAQVENPWTITLSANIQKYWPIR
jgi:Zn-finger nucleic acid-binding protein